MDENSPGDLSGESTLPGRKGSRFNPWLFFGVLAIPGIISIIVAIKDSSDYGEKAFLTLVICSVIAGLICGIHFTLVQRSMAIGLKVVIGIVSVIGCAGAAFAIGFGGCYVFFVAVENF